MTTAGIVHKGAGILFVTKEGKGLFLKRGNGGDAPGMWCFPGGTTEANETPIQTAEREATEELGAYPKGARKMHSRVKIPVPSTIGQPALGTDLVDFTTFVQTVTEEFTPELNGEHTGYAWAALSQPPEPLHPGCQIALQKFGWNELDTARAIRDGMLTSPQKYDNVWLFDLRITGTGVSYRGPKYDEKDVEVTPEEFVYRRPENYLTDEFVQRCNGLQVIMMHPKKAVLDSKEFGERTVGAMMLPYIKGDEVWGIAKIYVDEVADMLQSEQMSTSPGVLLGNGDYMMKTEDGTNLLVEGNPRLLDHLAICERGVWDKGGEPTGVRTDNQGDVNMPLSKEDLEAVGKLINDGISASVPGLVKTTFEGFARADEAGGQKLDKTLSALDSFMSKMDSNLKDLTNRMDAMEEKKDRKDKFCAKMDGESDDDMKKRMDADEEDAKKEHMAKGDSEEMAMDKAKKDRKDAEEKMEKSAKDRKDAEEKEEMAKKDAAARKDAATDSANLASRLAATEAELRALKGIVPKQLSDTERYAYAGYQTRADEVFMALGKRAPHPLNGEDLFPYRKRLMHELKGHSPAWKDIDVLAIADEQTFAIAEKTILVDSAQSAKRPVDMQENEMREIVRHDHLTGRRTVEFIAPHSFVRRMKYPARRVQHIGLRKEA